MQNDSTANTILTVVLLLIVVVALIWFFRAGAPAAEDAGPREVLDIDVDVPEAMPEGAGVTPSAPTEAPITNP